LRIKICGLTKISDALKAEEIGYNALGVIVKSDSPRNINIQQAREIFNALGPYITKVCVTTTSKQKDINEIQKLTPDAIQLYTNPDELTIDRKTQIIQAVKAEENEKPSRKTNAILIDNSRGKGIKIDIKRAKKINKKLELPLILSGGLNPKNINEIKGLDVYGVDISSGVEDSPGNKNHRLMKKLHNKMRC